MSENIFEIVENFNSEELTQLSNKLNEQNFRESLISKNEFGQTPLHVACQLGYTKMIFQLLEYLEKLQGIEEVINGHDNNHYTPLILVIKSTDDGIPEAVEALLKYHANPNISDNQGNTPLHYAASMGQEECVEYLLNSKQIHIDSQNQLGETPLIQSIIEGQFNIINMLLNHKIDLEIQDKKGRSAIHYAAITKGNSPAYIRILADKCDLNKKDNQQNTPLLLAASTSLKKHYRAIETLITLKVDLLARNNQNKLAQNYVEELDQEDKQTEYYTLLKNAFRKKGVILIEEDTQSKRETHKSLQDQNEEEKEEEIKIEEIGGCCGSDDKGGCCGSDKKDETENKNAGGCCSDSKTEDQSNKKAKKCCGSGNCSDKKEGKSCGGNCGCDESKKNKSNTIQNNSISINKEKKGFDFTEKFIIAALVPLNILFFYLLFSVFTQSK